MKRLTDTRRSRCVFCKAADEECAFAAGEFSAPCPDYKTYQRLSAIEDILGDDYDLDRLKELLQKHRHQEVFLAPFKIGTHVFSVEGQKIDEWEVIGFSFGVEYIDKWGFSKEKYDDDTLVIAKGVTVSSGIIFQFTLSEIGETAFLSRKEAEAALEKMKEGNNQ